MSNIMEISAQASQLSTGENLLQINETDGYFNKIYYISDLHLDDKIDKKDMRLNEVAVQEIVDELAKQIGCFSRRRDYLLVAGDVGYEFKLVKSFYEKLSRVFPSKNIIVVLGNHELWEEKYSGLPAKNMEDIISAYKKLFSKLRITFLHNEFLIVKKDKIQIIKEEEILTLETKKLQRLCNKSSLLVLGGVGFSFYNKCFNAEHSIYGNTIKTLQEDRNQTQRFENIYRKLLNDLRDYLVLCLTHMPKEDWTQLNYQPNWIYINGHTHKNYYNISEEKTVYADNQIGYKKTKITGKYFDTSRCHNIFTSYKDGIYQIKISDYIKFNRQMNIFMEFNR